MKSIFLNLVAFLVISLTMNVAVAQLWTAKPIPAFASASKLVRNISVPKKDVIWVGSRGDTTANWSPAIMFARSIDGGNTWNSGNIGTNANMSIVSLTALNKDTAFAALSDFANLGGALFRTYDGGTTWTKVPNTFTAATSFPDYVAFFDNMNGVAMGDPIISAVGQPFEIYTTSDGGNTWAGTSSVPTAIAADDYGAASGYGVFGNTIYAGSSYGRVFKSTDKGVTWIAKSTSYNGWVEDINVKNGNEMMALASDNSTGNGGLLKSTDGGDTWTWAMPLNTATQGTKIRTCASYVKGTSDTYAVGGFIGNAGLIISTNGGGTWSQLDNNTTIPTASGGIIWLDAQTGYASSNYVGTTLAPNLLVWTSGAVANEIPLVYENTQIYPNPTKGNVVFETQLVKRVPVTVSLTDVMGKVISKESYPSFTGKLNKTFYLGELSAGVYMITAQLGEQVITERIVKE